ncbi:AraC-like ligand-binding domain-containing protein [Streptomyces buecherae]|uniref:AraC-like ligand-binding domain-containing protein n=1 Tax=Streptomyces buecherae TaxID=2763006 RepID=UPI0037B04F3B
MLDEDVFSSEELPATDRFSYWHECMSRTHAPMALSSDHAPTYRAHQRLIRLGDASMWPANFDPLVFRRTPRLIRQSDPEAYHLSLLIHGEARVSWGTQEIPLVAGGFLINDSSRLYEIRTGSQRITSIGLEIPKRMLHLPISKADRVVGHPLMAREGMGALLAQFLTTLASNTSRYQPADAPRLGRVVNDLVSALFAHVLETEKSLPPETRQQVLLQRIHAFISAHLGDPQLTPAVIAAAHHISVSYLHRLFRDQGDTVAVLIRRQRLEGARRDMADPILRDTPVHEIAARWGFTHHAAFTRAFRAAHHLAPRDYRSHTHANQRGTE